MDWDGLAPEETDGAHQKVCEGIKEDLATWNDFVTHTPLKD